MGPMINIYRKSCQEKIMSMLKYGDSLNFSQIKIRSGYSDTTIQKNLKKLLKENKIKRIKKPGYYLYKTKKEE